MSQDERLVENAFTGGTLLGVWHIEESAEGTLLLHLDQIIFTSLLFFTRFPLPLAQLAHDLVLPTVDEGAEGALPLLHCCVTFEFTFNYHLK